MAVIIETNEYQTPITEDFLANYPEEVREQFIEMVHTIPFIQNLISPNRPNIKDLPRDETGRAIIDITNPPIYEDADYFRQAALVYLKEGCYTKLRPNKNPNSEFRKFWDKEIEKCYKGVLRKSDGMYIPGYMYWFLNYCPMVINKYQKGKKKALRTEGFPYFFEGIWFRFLYLEKAREEGHHAVELAKRGAHPYFQQVYTPNGWKDWGDINIGDTLYGTYGNITRVIDVPVDEYFNEYYKVTLNDGRHAYATYDHLWKVRISNSKIYSDGEYILPTVQLEVLLWLKATLILSAITTMTDNNIIIASEDTQIASIKYIEERVKCKCVTVDAEDECYLIGNNIPTHNCGKSYTLSSIMSHNLILGESEIANKRCITVLTAYQKEYLKDDKDGTFSKFTPTLSFLSKNTPFPRLMVKQSSNDMTWQMGYKDAYGRTQGSLNIVMGVSAKDDSDKLRGKRGYILFEEFGNFPSLLELYDVTRKSVEDGDYTFALMYLLGTSNNKESNFQSAKTLLYGTESYNILSLNNVYDKKGQGNTTFGFFFASYLNRAGCYNKDGISDVVKALMEILMNRYKAKYGADPTSILRVIAEDPITPAEAIIKVKDAYFPIQQLTERAQELDTNPRLYDDVYVGELIENNLGEITFTPTDDIPIRKFPVDNDTKGALEIYSMPEKDKDNKVFDNRYIIGVDPYDNDQADSSSLYSIFVFDLFTDLPAAEYTGRTTYANDAHELVLKLAKFYNARALYEANKKGLFAYMESKHSTYLLADTPEYLRDKQMIKYSSFGSNSKGVNASATINNYANRLIKDWLLKKVPREMKEEDGTTRIVEVPILYSIKNRAFIEEAIQFNPVLNVDRIRAFGMVMLYREEFIIKYGGNLNKEAREKVNKTNAEYDDFFTRNYEERKVLGVSKFNYITD